MRRATITPLLLVAAAPSPNPGPNPGPNPWLGTWSLRVPAGEPPETLVYSDAGHGTMQMESVEAKSVILTRFDGHPVPDTGAGAATGSARKLAVTAVTPTRYRWTFAIAGKPFVAGINTLAADARTLPKSAGGWRHPRSARR